MKKNLKVSVCVIVLILVFGIVGYATENVENSNKNQILENTVQNEIKLENEVLQSTSEPKIEYKGEVNLETPKKDATYKIPDTEKIKITGWALSNDKNAKLNIYVDNQLVESNRIEKEGITDEKLIEYGGIENTEKPGFEADINISEFEEKVHNIKVEQVAQDGNVIGSVTRNFSVKQRTFKGRMYLESPAENEVYTVPDKTTMKIEGWAVSDDAQAKVNVYVDNQLIENTRISRGDVDTIVSPEYGGTSNTPKAGFVANVDITNLRDKTLTIKIEEVSRYGKIITSTTRKVTTKTKNMKGRMYIERPNAGEKFEVPATEEMKIEGWAVSNDPKAKVNIYVNGKLEEVTRISRGDVDSIVSPEYGGTANTPKAGFVAKVKIKEMLDQTLTIKIEQVSQYGKVITSETRTVTTKTPKYKGRMYIEKPNAGASYEVPTTEEMKIEGWAVSNDQKAKVNVYVNGNMVQTTRISRGDVDSIVSPEYGGTANTPKAGFVASFRIKDLRDQILTIKIEQVSQYGKVITSETRTVTTKTPNYSGRMYIETPVSNGLYPTGMLEIVGWAANNAPSDRVAIYLDGRYITNAEKRSRNDVVNAVGGQFGLTTASNPGFYSRIITSGLSEGYHTIKVVNISLYDKVIQEQSVNIVISNTRVSGIDVSHYQGDINWAAVKSQGISFAILKIGEYRESSGRIIYDSKFEQNYNACKRYGIAVGGYFYSYEFNSTEAAHEAEKCLSIIRGKSFEFPIFLDLEDKIIINAIRDGRTNVANVTDGAITFCNILNANGYKSGVYANKNFLNNYLNTPALEGYSIWLAHYTAVTDYARKYDIWQHSSSGTLNGINGYVDLDICYRKY